ncbi:MAG TPA: NAD(P)-binding protein, partial [Ideonella sp.]|nr:NAD(P)-binding protein [Ideonella sp.]
MDNRQSVVILGGGMAALAAAHELSRTADLRRRYRVTVLQRGWRLGGKCASSRSPHPADPRDTQRIEEHGLHVWFGFYVNAFRLMRDCYAQLGWLAFSIAHQFERRNSTPLMEHYDGRWILWPLDFPADPPGVEPGFKDTTPTLAQIVERLTQLAFGQLTALQRELLALGGADWQPLSEWLSQLLASPQWTILRLPPVKGVMAKLRGTFDALVGIQAPPPEPAALVPAGLQDLLSKMARTALDSPWDRLRARIELLGPDEPDLFDRLRRMWLIADLAGAALRGLGVESGPILAKGLDALDDRDLRQWLSQHGAHDESVSSAPVRALYDLCFAYSDGDSTSFSSANFAAGAALRCALRIGLGYQGAVCYTMTAGMGESVIAPLHQLLERNGVGFEFFHRVESLKLDGQGRVAELRIRRQAKLQSGKAYDPLRTLASGMKYWPPRPRFELIQDGAQLEQRTDIDFESDLSPPWKDEAAEIFSLRQDDGRLAKVVLAISVEPLKGGLSDDIGQVHPPWRTMLSDLSTVATQSAQLWFNRDVGGLGYRDPKHPPAMIAAPEPMDVWADMSSVIKTEQWDAQLVPASVQYICGPLAGSFASVVAAQGRVRSNTAVWLDRMGAAAWRNAYDYKSGSFDYGTLV